MGEATKGPVRKMVLDLDELDYRAVQRAIARRQTFRVMPDDEGSDTAGAVIAEICRGWLEMLDWDFTTGGRRPDA